MVPDLFLRVEVFNHTNSSEPQNRFNSLSVYSQKTEESAAMSVATSLPLYQGHTSKEGHVLTQPPFFNCFQCRTGRPSVLVKHASYIIWSKLVFFLIFIFIYLAAPGLSCSMWDLVPWPENEPRPPALGAWSLSHWTTSEVPEASFIRASHPRLAF